MRFGYCSSLLESEYVLPLTLRGCIYIAWLFYVPRVIKRNHMDLLHFRPEYSCLNWLVIRSRRRYMNKFLFQSRRSCLDWWLLHKLVGVPVHAQMSELAIDRVPMLLPDLTYAPVSAAQVQPAIVLVSDWCSCICSCYNTSYNL